MRIIDFGPRSARRIDQYGSVGFTMAPLARGQDSLMSCLRLAPGGRIGRHEAVRRQLLAVVVGDAVVAGADGAEQELSAGRAAVWEAAEMHHTRSVNGMTAIVIEGDIA